MHLKQIMKRLEKDIYTMNNDFGMTNMEKLFREHYVSMVFYALKTVKDKNIAEDIVQDVFIRLIQRRDTLQLESNAKYLLFISLRNAIIDHQRKASHHFQESIVDTPDDFSLEESMFEIELYKQLYDAIKILPTKCRKVIEMRLEGKDEHAIAAELDISYETVRTHIKNATKKLRDKFGDTHVMSIFLTII